MVKKWSFDGSGLPQKICLKIGQKVVERALAFGFEIRVYDPFYEGKFPKGVNHYEDIYDAVLDTDVLSLHVPLIESTKNLIDKKIINLNLLLEKKLR